MTTPPLPPFGDSSFERPDRGVPPSVQFPEGAAGDEPNPLLVIAEVLLAVILVFFLIVTPLVGLFGLLPDTETSADAAATGALSIILSLGVYQLILAAYPWLFEYRRGRSIKEFLRFDLSWPEDLGFGIIMFIFCFLGAQGITYAISQAVGLDDSDSASNTGILEDNRGSWILFVVIFFVVVGAPLAEELLFRGFIMRYLEKFFGVVFAVVASSIIFAIPHWQPDASWQESAVLLGALAFVGLVLAIGAMVTKRLGAAIIAHALFNATGTFVTLFWPTSTSS